MATGTIILPIAGATLPDGSANNAAAQFQRVTSSAAAPAAHFVELLFDPSTDEHAFWSFRMPADYASGLVAKLQWKANSTTAGHSVVWVVKVGTTTPGDADTPNEHALAADNSATTDVNTTEARRLIETSITLTNADSVAAGDFVTICVKRDADAAGDDCTVDAELVAVSLEYTTS